MTVKRPFRFGIQAGANFGLTDPNAWLDHARQAEDLGYAVLLAPDHFAPYLSPLIALAAAAQVTKTIRLGTLVINQAWRHPAVLAKEAATLDLLSGGRLELGLGTGWIPREQEQVGIGFDSFGERYRRFEEYLAIVKGLLEHEYFTFQGSYYQVTELQQLPRPVQRPRPPIMIGAYGRRMIGLAMREADIFSFASAPAPPGDPREILAERAAWVQELGGDRLDQIELSHNCGGGMPVGTPRAQAARLIVSASRQRGGLARPRQTYTEEELIAIPSQLIGTVDEVMDLLVEHRERFGISYVTYLPSAPDYLEAVRAFGQVVKRLAGT